jgi:DNA invertase Pin-like site-specific DNA recombinase
LKNCKVISIKDNYRLGDDIQSKVLAFAFGLSAEIERNLISQRTKEALALRKKDGIILGRPKGKKSSHTKLTGKEPIIHKMLLEGCRKKIIAQKFHVHRNTLDLFIKRNNLT